MLTVIKDTDYCKEFMDTKKFDSIGLSKPENTRIFTNKFVLEKFQDADYVFR